MSAATVIEATGFIGNPESTEATLSLSSGLEPLAMGLKTKHLSRSVLERVPVGDFPGDPGRARNCDLLLRSSPLQ
jgi:hypothetical protein